MINKNGIVKIIPVKSLNNPLTLIYPSDKSILIGCNFSPRPAAKLGLFVGSEGRSTIAHLTAEALRRYQFAFPPLAEQQAIATFLDNEITKFDTLTAEANRAIALLQERRSALISATVTGKIDVRHACEVFRGQGKGGTTARLLTDREADATREV